jgi:hypothetical protein
MVSGVVLATAPVAWAWRAKGAVLPASFMYPGPEAAPATPAEPPMPTIVMVATVAAAAPRLTSLRLVAK